MGFYKSDPFFQYAPIQILFHTWCNSYQNKILGVMYYWCTQPWHQCHSNRLTSNKDKQSPLISIQKKLISQDQGSYEHPLTIGPFRLFSFHIKNRVATRLSPSKWSRIIIIMYLKINVHIIHFFVNIILLGLVPTIIVNFICILDRCRYFNTKIICCLYYPWV